MLFEALFAIFCFGLLTWGLAYSHGPRFYLAFLTAIPTLFGVFQVVVVTFGCDKCVASFSWAPWAP